MTDTPIADLIVAEVASTAYNPRTSEHSDNQSLTILRDLLAYCPLLAERAAQGEVVAKLKHHQTVGTDDWVIDIAIGSCAGRPVAPTRGEPIVQTEPAIIQIAIELKSIWTEHGKARKNRLRDFNSFHGFAHRYGPKTVAVAFLVVNAADNFISPLNLNKTDREALTRHGGRRGGHAIAKETIDLFRTIHLRHNELDTEGLEAIGVVVVEHDNINMLQNDARQAEVFAKYRPLMRPTGVAKTPPSLKVGDPLHYTTMIQRMCAAYTDRFR